LVKADDVAEMTRMLESTWYGPEIERASSLYSPPELLEVALNRHIVEINKIVLETVPFSGKLAIRAYLLKWDIHNIELILSSKLLGVQSQRQSLFWSLVETFLQEYLQEIFHMTK